jgi:hypothetical protein
MYCAIHFNVTGLRNLSLPCTVVHRADKLHLSNFDIPDYVV